MSHVKPPLKKRRATGGVAATLVSVALHCATWSQRFSLARCKSQFRRVKWKVLRYTSHFYRDTFAKVCALLAAHHLFASWYGPHLHRDSTLQSVRVRGRGNTPKQSTPYYVFLPKRIPSLRVQSRLRMQLRIVASIVFFGTFKKDLKTIAPRLRGWTS